FVVTMMGASLSALHIHLFDGAGQAISIKRLCQHWRVWHLSVDALHDPIIVGVCRYENYRRAKYLSTSAGFGSLPAQQFQKACRPAFYRLAVACAKAHTKSSPTHQ